MCRSTGTERPPVARCPPVLRGERVRYGDERRILHSERSGAADLTGLISVFISGARGRVAVLLGGRRLAGRDSRRERLLKAIDETEFWHRAVLDLLYRHALDDKADSRQIEDYLATRPWPHAHADLLGPDRDAMLALSVRLMNAVGSAEALALWTEAQQLVGHRMTLQRKRVEAGQEPEQPTNPDPAGPFGA